MDQPRNPEARAMRTAANCSLKNAVEFMMERCCDFGRLHTSTQRIRDQPPALGHALLAGSAAHHAVTIARPTSTERRYPSGTRDREPEVEGSFLRVIRVKGRSCVEGKSVAGILEVPPTPNRQRNWCREFHYSGSHILAVVGNEFKWDVAWGAGALRGARPPHRSFRAENIADGAQQPRGRKRLLQEQDVRRETPVARRRFLRVAGHDDRSQFRL